MDSLGIVYAWNTYLPSFDSVRSLVPSRPSKLVSQLKDMNMPFSTEETKNTNNSPLGTVAHKEKQMFDSFSDILHKDIFFTRFIFLESAMSTIRKLIRGAILHGDEAEIEYAKHQISELCQGDRLLEKTFNSYIDTLPKDPEEISLFEIERQLDKLYFEVLKKSINPTRLVLKKYLALLQSQAESEAKLRTYYARDFDAQHKEAEPKDETFKQFAIEKCQFVNKSTFTFNPDLLTLQSLVRYTFLYYNLRILASDLDVDKNELLVDYTVN